MRLNLCTLAAMILALASLGRAGGDYLTCNAPSGGSTLILSSNGDGSYTATSGSLDVAGDPGVTSATLTA